MPISRIVTDSLATAAATTPKGGTGLSAPGAAGNVLTSNGTIWTSAPASAFDVGTVMLFVQSTAPTGWTKLTNLNDVALRVVSGTAGTGGATAFSTVFTNQTINLSGLTVGNTTLTLDQIPSHGHAWTASSAPGGGPISNISIDSGNPGTPYSYATNNVGGGMPHTHPLTGGTGVTVTLNVSYVDVIRASKN